MPDAMQEALLRCDAKQGILNCSRQWGKSTVAAIKAVHRAHTVAKSMVVVACPTERQSAEFVLKARGFVTKLGLRARGMGMATRLSAAAERVAHCGAAWERG